MKFRGVIPSRSPIPQRLLWRNNIPLRVAEDFTVNLHEHLKFSNRVSPRIGKAGDPRQKLPDVLENLASTNETNRGDFLRLRDAFYYEGKWRFIARSALARVPK